MVIIRHTAVPVEFCPARIQKLARSKVTKLNRDQDEGVYKRLMLKNVILAADNEQSKAVDKR